MSKPGRRATGHGGVAYLVARNLSKVTDGRPGTRGTHGQWPMLKAWEEEEQAEVRDRRWRGSINL